MPAKILLFVDLTKSFKKKFKVGDSIVDHAGVFVLGFSLDEMTEISHLLSYGNIIEEKNQPSLYMISVDAIEEPCIAVPWNWEESIIDAKTWVFIPAENILVPIIPSGMQNIYKET